MAVSSFDLSNNYKGKVGVSFSGGIDSVVLYHYYKNEGYDVKAFLLKPDKDEDFAYSDACKVLQSYDIKSSDVITIPMPRNSLLTANVKSDNKVMNEKLSTSEFLVGWKLLMLFNILSVGSAQKFDFISMGHTIDDVHFLDEQQSTFDRCIDLFNSIYGNDITPTQFRQPFVMNKLTDSDVIKLAQDLNVNLKYTMSCDESVAWLDSYKEEDKIYFREYLTHEAFIPIHCGKCQSCKARKERFIKSGIKDPTIYAE